MIDWIDWMLLILYTTAVGCATYVLIAHRKYFHERFRKGIISAFMLAMLFFLAAYDIKMITAMWMRSSVIFGYQTPLVEEMQRVAWLIAHVGTTIGLIILARLTYTKRYDIWIFLKRKDDKK